MQGGLPGCSDETERATETHASMLAVRSTASAEVAASTPVAGAPASLDVGRDTPPSSNGDRAMERRKLTIVIPCFNERRTILTVLEKVQSLPIDKTIIVVDNHSNDGTRELLAAQFDQPRACEADPAILGRLHLAGQRMIRSGSMVLVLQPKNASKGTSLKTALKLANSDYFVCQDADLEYEPQDIVKLLAHAEETQASAVFGSRLLQAVVARRDIYHTARVGLTKLFSLLYDSPLSDVATCYKLMKTSTARELDLQSAGFDLDFEIPAKLRRLGHDIHEIPIRYFPRDARAGKKLTWKHGSSAVWALLRYRAWAPRAARVDGTSHGRQSP